MSESGDDIYSGGTKLNLVCGRALDHLQAGIYTGANIRGVMAAGLAAELRRAAGAEVERELRSHLPLQLGRAYLTSPGLLGGHGVQGIAHGVVANEPGGGASLDISIRAMVDGLSRLEDAGCRTVTIPQIGFRVANLDQEVAAAELAKVIVAHLRRKSKLTTVTIVSMHQDYLDALAAAFRREIERSPVGERHATG
jgi:O-acetyl-ADP-ribose deacetylase (regulator of RNase III)